MGNMKGALAAMCVATVILKRHSNTWKGRLTMTAVSDEVMFGERGTVFLLRQRPDVAGDFLISGEGPGFMHLAVAEKGLLWLDVEARSAGGHASRALRGETAVVKLAAFLARIDAMNEMYATLPRELAGVSGGEGNLGLRLSLNAGVCYGPQPTLSAGIDDYVNEQDVVDCAKIYARTMLALMRR
jgi:succinyl-diaminopimelate desuccinylase